MNKENIIKWISYVGKGLSLLAGGASYLNYIPEKWQVIALLAFGISSILKDTVNRIGDLLDDGQANNSFK